MGKVYDVENTEEKGETHGNQRILYAEHHAVEYNLDNYCFSTHVTSSKLCLGVIREVTQGNSAASSWPH